MRGHLLQRLSKCFLSAMCCNTMLNIHYFVNLFIFEHFPLILNSVVGLLMALVLRVGPVHRVAFAVLLKVNAFTAFSRSVTTHQRDPKQCSVYAFATQNNLKEALKQETCLCANNQIAAKQPNPCFYLSSFPNWKHETHSFLGNIFMRKLVFARSMPGPRSLEFFRCVNDLHTYSISNLLNIHSSTTYCM